MKLKYMLYFLHLLAMTKWNIVFYAEQKLSNHKKKSGEKMFYYKGDSRNSIF